MGQFWSAATQAAAGAGQQVQGGRFDAWTVNAHRRQTLLEVLSDQRCRPGVQGQVAGNAREERAVLAHAQRAQEVFVADEHQSKGRRVRQVQAQEQTHFFETAVTKALSFVQDDQRDYFAQFGQSGLDQRQVGFAAEGGSLTQLGGQGPKQAAAAEAGVSQQQWAEQAPVQTVAADQN